MELYLFRHGDADGTPGVADEHRALTARGVQSVREVLIRAREAGAAPSLILSSPLRRAVETARLAQEVLGGPPPVLLPALALARWPEELWEEVRAYQEQAGILLAGHNPLLSAMFEWLTRAPGAMEKAALAAIHVPIPNARPRGALRWLLVPDRLTS